MRKGLRYVHEQCHFQTGPITTATIIKEPEGGNFLVVQTMKATWSGGKVSHTYSFSGGKLSFESTTIDFGDE